ncbi:small integral membrane protein 24 isoform X2 [Dendropsophus ebraccatus]|uniref:small integral membrane protein 24 isoform X2 n=1 Tax=Dendropsophus ebraccatus TaxID=150705 RepID=UPI0038313CE0
MTTTGKIIIGFLFVISANAQQGMKQESSSSNTGGLQPWLLGLTAMVVFLFIVFILLIVNRVWCKKRRGIDEEDNKKERTDASSLRVPAVPSAWRWNRPYPYRVLALGSPQVFT